MDPARLRLARHSASLSQEQASAQAGMQRDAGKIRKMVQQANQDEPRDAGGPIGRPLTWFVPRAKMRTNTPSLPSMHYDEVLEAYSIAQPHLRLEAVRSIAHYIQFLHNRELDGRYQQALQQK